MKDLKNKLTTFLLIQLFLVINPLCGQGLFQLRNHSKTASGWGTGSAISSINNNIDGVFLNPATLVNAPNFYHANFTNFILDINTTSISFGRTSGKIKYAANISYMNYGDFDKYDDAGNSMGDFSANDKEFSMVVARKLGNYLSAGLITSWLHSEIDDYNASAITMGLGFQYYVEQHKFAVSLSFNNFDKMLSNYSDYNENIPNLILLGVSKQLLYLPAVVSFDLLKYNNLDIIGNLGVKFSPTNYYSIFLGTSSRKIELQNQSGLKSLLSGVSLGFGFQIKTYNFDVSYSSLGDAGEITSFSIYKLLG